MDPYTHEINRSLFSPNVYVTDLKIGLLKNKDRKDKKNLLGVQFSLINGTKQALYEVQLEEVGSKIIMQAMYDPRECSRGAINKRVKDPREGMVQTVLGKNALGFMRERATETLVAAVSRMIGKQFFQHIEKGRDLMAPA